MKMCQQVRVATFIACIITALCGCFGSANPCLAAFPLSIANAADEAEPQHADFLASEPTGWLDMMPHTSFKHWTRVPVPPDKPLDPMSQWKLSPDRGLLICEGDHGHEWLRYNHEFANFIVHVEWRFEPREGLKGYNSGVFIRNDLTGGVWHQAQVGTSPYIFGQTLSHGQLTPMIKTPTPAVNPLHPVGEWNTYEVRCLGPKIALWVNGEFAAEFQAPEVLHGYWGLEAEHYRIEFRNIKLKVLK
jgi:hypothetical protein